MKVREKKTQIHEIRLGDIFADKEGRFYVLGRTYNNRYEALSLSGNGIWSSDENFDALKERLLKAINEDRMRHYSQEIYQLMIDKI